MIRLFTLILTLLFSNFVLAEIVQTNDYAIIEKFVKKTNQQTLVMFDLDDVLTLPTNPYNISYPLRKKHVKEIEKKYGEGEAKNFWSIIFMNRKIKFVDNKIPGILDDIEKRKIPTIALTKCFTHNYGKIDNAHDWRISELKSLNVDFSKFSPLKGTYRILDIIPVNGRPSSIPMLKSGVIFTARADKGMILEKIFKKYNYYPKKILFIDDKYKNLASIEKLSKKYNIKFDGIIITKAYNLPRPKLEPQNEERRFQILENEEKWVID